MESFTCSTHPECLIIIESYFRQLISKGCESGLSGSNYTKTWNVAIVKLECFLECFSMCQTFFFLTADCFFWKTLPPSKDFISFFHAIKSPLRFYKSLQVQDEVSKNNHHDQLTQNKVHSQCSPPLPKYLWIKELHNTVCRPVLTAKGQGRTLPTATFEGGCAHAESAMYGK